MRTLAARLGRGMIPALILVMLGILIGHPADAHTAVESTVPADGEVVVDPVEQITVTFTEAVKLVGSGFEVLLPDLTVVTPEPSTADGVVYVLTFDPPITGGAVGVRFSVTSADGHVVDGSFSFVAPDDAPTTTAPPTPLPATTAPAATTPVTTELTAPATTEPVAEPPAVSPATSTPVAVADVEPSEITSGPDDEPGGGNGVVIGIGVGVVLVAIGAAIIVSRRRAAVG